MECLLPKMKRVGLWFKVVFSDDNLGVDEGDVMSDGGKGRFTVSTVGGADGCIGSKRMKGFVMEDGDIHGGPSIVDAFSGKVYTWMGLSRIRYAKRVVLTSLFVKSCFS